MLDSIFDIYGAQAHSAVIPNGRDSSLFAPGKKQSLIFSAGRLWDEAKNILAVQRIAGQLPWPVYVAGDVTPPPGARGAFDSLAVNSLGCLFPFEVAEWMARASIYCLPARYEPFGLSVLEAALCGCALVLGDIPSLRENWDGVAAFVSPDDPEALSAALTELANSRRMRHALAKRARKRALQFTPHRMARRYIQIYAALRSHQTSDSRGSRETSACAS